MLALIVAGGVVLCLLALEPGRSQTTELRRISNTTAEGFNINPSLSGDGHIVAFESTEDVAGAGGSDHFRAIRANVSVDPANFYQIGGTRAVAAAISQDGSRIAFASKDDPLGTNADGNSEIFLFDGARLIQVTDTSPGDIANRVRNGNFQPSISDDGRFIAFSSNRDLTGQNSDGNLEIFVCDSVASTFAQLTNSFGIVAFSDAKISGNGASVAYIRDNGASDKGDSLGTSRDLLLQPRDGAGPATVLAANVPSLQMTYGRAISDDGSRVVYSGETATNSSQVFLYDARGTSIARQITSLGVRATEVPLHPTISGDGTRIAFATRRTITGFSNSDNSIELYTHDLATGQFGRLTNAPGEGDGFDGTTLATEVVSSLNDDGTTVAFNFPRALSGPVTAGLENRSEIYVTATATRPPFGELIAILNGASFSSEPSAIKAVAPDSIAVARGNALANSTMQSQRLPNGSFPTNVGGTTVTVNGRAAQIFFVSPGQVNFLVPPQTEAGNADVVVTNIDGFASRASVPTLRAAPGVFTSSGDGMGEGMILSSDTLQEGPFDPSSGNLGLTIFATGARNAIQTVVALGGRVVDAESVMPSLDMAGLDEVHVRVPADLRGAGTVSLSVQSDGRESNPVTVTFTGDPGRAVFINEVLADLPDGIAGDANHDGVRDGTQDEFVELVNGTATEAISLGGWTIRTRANGGATETTRFTFASGTTLPAGEAIVVFGGGNATFNPNDNVFGCAQVLKTSLSAGLSLTNGGLTILVRDGAGNPITQFTYGGSSGLDGGNNQSLTRSPDVTGIFVQHTSATGANAKRFSPGLKVDGAPLGNCPSRLTTVKIAPPNASITVRKTTQFTAHAFDQFGRPMNSVPIDFASDDTTVATISSVSTNSSTGVATATVSGHNPGTAHLTASATDGSTTVNSSQSTLTVTGPSLSINDVRLNEGNSGPTTFTFTVSLSQPAPTGGITFNIATQDGAATNADNDYLARSLTAQTIPAGQQTYTFDVTVNGDLSIEANENFFVNVTNVSGASVSHGEGLGTILNDDSPVLSINDVSANEGNSGTSTLTFTVSSTLPAPAGGITFDISTQDNTATVTGKDYVSWSRTGQTIPAGQQTYILEVTVNGDLLVEPNESLFVNISNVSANAAVSDSQGVATIQNDDNALLVISQLYGGGNNSGAPFRNDFVEIYNRGATTVDFAVTPYSLQYASVGSNFGSSKTNLTSGTVAPGRYFLVREAGGTTNGAALPTPDATGTIALGSTSGKLALVAGTNALATSHCPGDDGSTPFNPNNTLIADLVGYGSIATNASHCYEGAEPAHAPSNTTADYRKAGGCFDTNENGGDFFVASPNPRNSNSPIGACKPEITINDVTVTEGNTGTKIIDFTVTLSAPSVETVTVDFGTADGTAIAPADYQAQSGVLTFNPGDLTKTITVLLNGDTLDEPNESLFVNLSNVANAVLIDSQGQGTITDNDAAPSLSINDLSIAEGNAGFAAFTFTVSLSAASGKTVTVNYATADNTAVAGNDYQTTSGALTFNPGDTSKPIAVLVKGDSTFEQNETFFVSLTTPMNASISDSQGQGTITNDDAAPPTPTLFISDVSITESNSGTSIAQFDVTLSPSSSNTVRVDYATANGTATPAGNDYQSAGGTLIFNPGEASKPVSITIYGDTLVELDETFAVNLSKATGGAAIGTPSGAGTIQNDDTALLVISQLYGGGGNSGATFQNDFVEIFNRGTTTIDFAVTPYSVQYASSAGSFTSGNKVDLTTGTIAVGQYFLLKLNSGGAVGATFTGDITNTGVNLSAPNGKVALVAGTTVAITAGGCPTNVPVADLVGYGSANCSEPTPVAALSATKSALRKSNGCTDTNNNLADFTTPTLSAGAPPRNTSSQIHDCNAPPDLTIDNVTAAEGNSGTSTFTFTMSLSAPAPAPVTFNIATQDGTATVGDNDYVPRSLTGQTIAAGQQTYTFDVAVNGDVNIEPNETFLVNITNVSGASVLDGQGQGTIQNDDIPALSIDDVSASEGDSGTTTVTFHVTLSIPAGPGGVTFDIVTADISAQDHNPINEDNDYVARSLTNQTIPAGQSSYDFDVAVNGDTTVEGNETFSVSVTNLSGATVLDGTGTGTIQNDDNALVAISQVYGGGGNSGATFKNDFIEIFNRGTTIVDLAGWSVQYTSATGTGAWSVTPLCATGPCLLLPGRYFLVQEGQGAGGTVDLPSPDAKDNIAMSPTAGKVAVVSNTTPLSGSCPSDNSILDQVGYGSTASCFEGAGPTAAPSNTLAEFRKAGGCTDTNNNAADFLVSAPFPRNSSSSLNDCAGGAAPNLTINDVTVTEGDSGTTTASFTVSLSAPAQGADVTFDIATQNNSALSGSDYVAKTLTNQTIPAGLTSSTFDVIINGDTTVEPDEIFFVNVANVINAIVTDGQGVGTIQHDDLPTLSIDDASAAEGDGGTKTFTFHVTLSDAAPSTVSFDIFTVDATAQDGNPGGEDNDYQARSLTAQTIAQGSSSFNFDVTVNGDMTIEPNETFLVNIVNVSGATVLDGQAQATIQNDDSPVLSIDDVTASEGDSGATTLTFHVTLSIPAGPSGVTFDITTVDGTAQDDNPVSEDNDYVANSTNHTIPTGQSSYNFDVTVNGDTIVEANETFSVNVTNGTGATVTDGSGVGTIQNDDLPLVVISQLYGGGGNSGATFKNDFIEIFNRGTTMLDLAGWSVQYAGATGTGAWSVTPLCPNGPCLLLPGRYFLVQEDQGAGGTANLPAPDAIGTIAMTAGAGKVALVSNTTPLSGACPSGAAILDKVGYGSSANCFEGSSGPATAPSNTAADVRKGGGCADTNDNAGDFFTHASAPRNSSTPANACSGQTADIVISDVTVTEGNSGTVAANFTVSLIAASASQVTVDYATANGTALAPDDYQSASGTLIFKPGEASKFINVLVKSDTLDEHNETFFVNLTTASNAGILDSQAEGTITDDDVPPALTISEVSQNETNSGTTTFAFTVHLSAPALTGGVTFDIATADGTAEDGEPITEDNDYVGQSLTGITIPAGSQDYIFNVTVNGDTLIESNEIYFVNVTNVSGATVGEAQGQGTIQNDDSPALSINDVTQTEGDSGASIFTFTVTSSLPAPAGGITFDIATADGTAQDDNPVSEDNDYVARSLSGHTIPEGQTTYTFDVTVNGDTKNEAICETFLVNLSNPINATILDGQGQGGITDNDGPKVIITQVYGGGSNAGATFQNDFVELLNRGSSTVNFSVTPYSVQYASAAGTFSTANTISLNSGSIAAGQYFLIKLAPATPTTGAALPTPDAINTAINLSATDGKVALVVGTTVATTTLGCPTIVTVADLVGYGTANCSETTPTTALSATRSARRTSSCTDTNSNSVNFTVVSNPAAPRNSATALSPCGCDTSYASLFNLGDDSWKATQAALVDRQLFPAISY